MTKKLQLTENEATQQILTDAALAGYAIPTSTILLNALMLWHEREVLPKLAMLHDMRIDEIRKMGSA